MKNTCGIISVVENPLMRELTGGEPVILDAQSVRSTLEQAIAAGTTEFLVAMDENGGLLAAETILDLKKERPELRLTCLMLWEEQAAYWEEHLRNRWFAAFGACDREVLLEHRRGKDNLQKCVRYLRDYSPNLIVFGGVPA